MGNSGSNKMTLKDLTDLQKIFVTFDRYSPVEKIVYGAMGIGFTAGLVKILSLIFVK
jgi:hypothetical protein